MRDAGLDGGSRTVRDEKTRQVSAGFGGYGAGDRNRTHDILITSEALYQLSYTGMGWTFYRLSVTRGTPCTGFFPQGGTLGQLAFFQRFQDILAHPGKHYPE